MFKSILTLIAAIMMLAARASAKLMSPIPTLDQLVTESDLVMDGTVVQIVKDSWSASAVVRVEERIKGTCGETISIQIEDPDRADSPIKLGERLLACLIPNEVSDSGVSGDQRPLEFRSTLRPYWRVLTHQGLFRLESKSLRIVSLGESDFVLLTEPAEIRAAARRAAGELNSLPSVEFTVLRWTEPDRKPLFFDDGSEFYTFPVIPRLERIGHAWLRNGKDDERTLQVLRHFPSPENAVFLRKLVETQARYSAMGSVDPFADLSIVGLTPARAWGTLQKWGYKTEKPPLIWPDDFYHRAGWRILTIGACCVAMLIGVARIAQTRYRIGSLFRVALAAAAVFTAALALHSYWMVHEICWNDTNRQVWLSAYRGWLQYSTLPAAPVRFGVPLKLKAYDHFAGKGFRRDRKPTREDVVEIPRLQKGLYFGWLDPAHQYNLWDRQYRTAASRSDFGILSMTSWKNVTARLINQTPGGVAYDRLEIHLGAISALLGIFPLCSLGTAIHRARRTRQRLAAGLCTHCGYDLRATPGRCPECGANSISEAAPVSGVGR